MAHKFNINEKFALYNVLIKSGFEALEKRELLDNSVPELNPSEIKTFLEAYKKDSSTSSSLTTNKWISNILELKQHYKHDAFSNVMSDVLTKKGHSLPSDDPYREVYEFLATVLKGELPKEQASLHTTMVVLLLMQDLNRTVQSTSPEELLACLVEGDKPTNEAQGADAEMHEQVKKRLMSLFKFQRINQFLNPLQMTSSANDSVHGSLLK